MPGITEMTQALPHAYIIYRPKTSGMDEIVTYNSAAHQICSFSLHPATKTTDVCQEISALCAKWKKILVKKSAAAKDFNEAAEITPPFLDLYQSGRRSYLVKGLLLSGPKAALPKRDGYYLFVLERVRSDLFNISRVARELNLSKREQDLVQLLLTDLGNKQIAHSLGLSLNTVKTYLKLLMRKLGVTSRAGIIACLINKMSQTSSCTK
jgi:DNA-binding CsgD family transcriptional regulator